MNAQGQVPSGNGGGGTTPGHWTPHNQVAKGHVLVVEDEELIRDSLGPLLEAEGYEVSCSENGREALHRLHTESPPDLIVLDLRMPVMDGWEFRTIQRDDPKLGRIPVVAISADGSPHAAAISAEAFLRKPVAAKDLLATIGHVLAETERQRAAQLDETERLAALGRLAAGVGHEINNPLTFMLLNLSQSLTRLQPRSSALKAPSKLLAEVELEDAKTRMAIVTDMLEDCLAGGERIRETVANLQRLSRRQEGKRNSLDLHALIEQAVSMGWNQIRHRARLIKTFCQAPPLFGNGSGLVQVFFNLLTNAAHAIPEGASEVNEIRISTRVEGPSEGPVEGHQAANSQIVVEIADSGGGIAPDVIAHVFEPFFTTKPLGEGRGLGLSVSNQTVLDHGGRMTVASQPGRGTVFRVFLPIGVSARRPASVVVLGTLKAPTRGHILVIDDEPLIGRTIAAALRDDHDVVVVQRAADAVARLERGETFDLVLCDVVMPDLSAPEFYVTLAKRWPHLVPRLVFMTGGAFTPGTVDFMSTVPTLVLAKPFTVEGLKRLVAECVQSEEHTHGNS